MLCIYSLVVRYFDLLFNIASGCSHMRVTWNALPDHMRTMADPVKFQKLLKSHFLVKLLTFVDSCGFLGVFNFWLTFVMHLWSRLSCNGRTINSPI